MPPDGCDALRRTQHRSHGVLVWNAQAAAKHEEILDKQKIRTIILGKKKYHILQKCQCDDKPRKGMKMLTDERRVKRHGK